MMNNEESFQSINQSIQSVTSETELRMLGDKLAEISQINQKLLEENNRLRKERNHYRNIVEEERDNPPK